MALDDILKRIAGDADRAAREILDGARRQADAILAEAAERSGLQLERMRVKARQRATEERNRIVTLAKLSARRELLNEKQGLIDKVFDETRKSIMAMPGDEYRRFIKRFLTRSVEAGDEEVLVGEGERRIDQKLLDEVSTEIGKPGGLKLSSERRLIDGGFILRRAKIETNCALDTIIRDARERFETDVADILFGPKSGR